MSENYTKQYLSKKVTDNNVIPYDESLAKRYREGIVVYMPKSKIKDMDYLDRTEVTNEDFLMDRNGQISVDNPNGGSAIMSSTSGGGYDLRSTTIQLDPSTGDPITETTNSYMPPDVTLKPFMETFQLHLDHLAMINIENQKQIAKMFGIKDSNKLFNE